jgi:hypothetical protein
MVCRRILRRDAQDRDERDRSRRIGDVPPSPWPAKDVVNGLERLYGKVHDDGSVETPQSMNDNPPQATETARRLRYGDIGPTNLYPRRRTPQSVWNSPVREKAPGEPGRSDGRPAPLSCRRPLGLDWFGSLVRSWGWRRQATCLGSFGGPGTPVLPRNARLSGPATSRKLNTRIHFFQIHPPAAIPNRFYTLRGNHDPRTGRSRSKK